MNRLPLHTLLGFAAAARSGNLTRAAESLHLTVSALSHQIRALEERMGRRLFVRGPRGVRLTADGERLLARITRSCNLTCCRPNAWWTSTATAAIIFRSTPRHNAHAA